MNQRWAYSSHCVDPIFVYSIRQVGLGKAKDEWKVRFNAFHSPIASHTEVESVLMVLGGRVPKLTTTFVPL